MSHELELIRVQQQHPGAPANWAADFMKQADHPAMFHQPGLAAIGIDAREFDEMEAVFQNASAQGKGANIVKILRENIATNR